MANAKPTGFIGVGVMGGPMAQRLIERGHALMVYDANPAALRAFAKLGARIGKSARDVADRCDTVFLSLPNPGVVREVVLGESGVSAGKAVKTVVDLCTNGPTFEKELAKALSARGMALVDAPISGGASGAAKGTLAVMVSGKAAVIAPVRAMLDVFGKVFVVGTRAGDAQTMKLLNNLLSLTAFAITSEAMVAGARAGLDADMMIDVLNVGSGRNSATQDKFPRTVLTRTFDFGFPVAGACKDIGLAIDECQALGVPMWVGSAARQLWQYAYAQGGGKPDLSTLVQHVEKWAGAEVRGKAAKPRARSKGAR